MGLTATDPLACFLIAAASPQKSADAAETVSPGRPVQQNIQQQEQPTDVAEGDTNKQRGGHGEERDRSRGESKEHKRSSRHEKEKRQKHSRDRHRSRDRSRDRERERRHKDRKSRSLPCTILYVTVFVLWNVFPFIETPRVLFRVCIMSTGHCCTREHWSMPTR